MKTVFLVIDLELPDCNYGAVYKVFSKRESAEQYLDELKHPKIGFDSHPERFVINEMIVEDEE